MPGEVKVRPIRTEEDYQIALKRAEALMDAEAGTPDGDELEVLAILIEAHEAKDPWIAELNAHAHQPGEPVAYVQKEILDALRRDKHVTGTVCSGLLKKPFGDPVPLYTAAHPAPPAPVAVLEGEEAIRLAEIGEYLYEAKRFSAGNGYDEPREMSISWDWQQSAPGQYGQGILLAEATKWHDQQAEDGTITEARMLRAMLYTLPTPALERSRVKMIANLVSIADASRREDGSDIPLGETLRKAAAMLAAPSSALPEGTERMREALEELFRTPGCVLFLDGRNERGSHVIMSYPTNMPESAQNDINEYAEEVLSAAEALGFVVGRDHVWTEWRWVEPQIGDEGRVELSGYWELVRIDAELTRAVFAPNTADHEGEEATIKATQISVGHGLVDVVDITHEGRKGILFHPRDHHLPIGGDGSIEPGPRWPGPEDVVIWIDDPRGAEVIQRYLAPFLPHTQPGDEDRASFHAFLDFAKRHNLPTQREAMMGCFEDPRTQAAHMAWKDRSTHPTAPKPAEVRRAGWILMSDDGKRWRICGPAGRWVMKPEGVITADEARTICETAMGTSLSPAPAAEEAVSAPTEEPDFVQGLQGFASMCESSARTGGMSPDDCNMVAGKLRDACFLIDTLQKLRDGKIALGWQLVPAPAAEEFERAEDAPPKREEAP